MNTLALLAMVLAIACAAGLVYLIHRDRSGEDRVRRINELRDFPLWPRQDLEWFVWHLFDSTLDSWRLDVRSRIVETYGEPGYAMAGLPLPRTASPELATVLIRLLTRHTNEVRQQIPTLIDVVSDRVLSGADIHRACCDALVPFDLLWNERLCRLTPRREVVRT